MVKRPRPDPARIERARQHAMATREAMGLYPDADAPDVVHAVHALCAYFQRFSCIESMLLKMRHWKAKR